MTATPIVRDERTVAVENAGYRWAYIVLTYGLLLIIGYRGLVRNESSWDLFALLFLGGAVTTLYQGRHRVLTRRWLITTAMGMVVALVLAAVLAVVLRAVGRG